MTRRGLPHSDIPGSKLVCSSPRLIAAYRVLHRLLAPRHSPYALSSLTTSFYAMLTAESQMAKLKSELNSDCIRLRRSAVRTAWSISHTAISSGCDSESLRQIRVSKRTTVCRIFSCQRTCRALGSRRAFGLGPLLQHRRSNSLPARQGSFAWRCQPQLTRAFAARAKVGGEYRARTGDLLVANQALSQLS